MSSKTPLSYRDAGVDIDAGNRLVKKIRPSVERTRRPEVLGGIGGFGGLFALPVDRYRAPVLVGATDGVGTKLKLALDAGRYDGIGTDLVAMCVNDVVVPGAEPLFFLDYYASGRLDVDACAAVIEGIARGCELAGAALLGGETAELPGMYQGADYDLAGFCVGVVERDRIIDGSRVAPGDRLIALASSGPHSNGYSLIREIHARNNGDIDIDNVPLIDALLAPTRIYVRPLLALCAQTDVHAMAHITGGGIVENLPRVLPDDMHAVVATSSWVRPAVFDWLQSEGGVADGEMWRTFNCGVGMVVCVPAHAADAALGSLRDSGERAWEIGAVAAGAGPVEFVS